MKNLVHMYLFHVKHMKNYVCLRKTLIKWQNSMNLISRSTIKNIWVRHFLDSAQLYAFVRNVEGNIIDFGSGAGFPGMVLAIMGKKTFI